MVSHIEHVSQGLVSHLEQSFVNLASSACRQHYGYVSYRVLLSKLAPQPS
jgi:hypothetical protein